MYFLCLCVLFFIPYVHLSVINIPGLKTSNNYGPYNMTIKYFGNCVTSHTKYVDTSASLATEEGSYIANFSLVFSETVRIDELRSLIQTVKNDKPITLLNYTLLNPCQKNSVLIQGFKTILGSRNCVIKKGEYNWNMNMSNFMVKFYGPKFFYGEFIFQFEYFTQKQQIICFRFDELFSKK